MIEIDGATGESGGQIIRTALTLSAITKKPVRIFNIRAKRPKPGLQAQHLTAVKAVRSICRGELEGAEIESKEISFVPGEIVGGKYDFNIGTAGSVVLVAQTIIPILLLAQKKSEVHIIGGTHVIKSPSYDYLERIFVPAVNLMNAQVKSTMTKSGYYPQGGGEIRIEVSPSKLTGRENWSGNESICVLIRISNLPMHVAIREKKIFLQNSIEDVKIIEESALDVGNAMLIWKGFNGIYSLGEKGKRAETVAEEALAGLKQEDGNVDRHLADQLLIYAVLAEERTSFKTSEITEHFRTNVEVISKFVDRQIEVKQNIVTVY